jgi:FkbM family methyltransferase
MKVEKDTGVSFNVKGKFSEQWFLNDRINKWEQATFQILEHYKDSEKGIYIDIGAWIGPTVLYSANIYNKVIAFEPDPIAIERLEENISANNFSNITLVKKALSNKIGTSKFGGNGALGNSESTLLIANDDYFTYEGRHTNAWKDKHNNIVEIETTVIETVLDELNINPTEISLIKMDIEGGEILVVPYLETFLKKYKPVFYISLHYCYLRIDDIIVILDVLFGVYDK